MHLFVFFVYSFFSVIAISTTGIMASCGSMEDSTDIPIVPKPGISPKCVKCNATAASIIARIRDPMCKVCFDAYFVHRFRATLGKSRLFLNEGRVLAAYSGGINSTSLLNMLYRGVNESSHKKLQFLVDVIFIDEESLFRENLVTQTIYMIEYLKTFGFRFYILPLESYFHPILKQCVQTYEPLFLYHDWPIQLVNFDEERTKLTEMFENIHNESKQSLLEVLRYKLLARFSYEFGYRKILTGQNASRLSTQLIHGICRGKGATARSDICFADERFHGLTFCRPMREFLSREIVFSVKIEDAKFFYFPNFNLINKIESKQNSIFHVTEDFLSELQSLHPFTISTVFKTGNKLSPSLGENSTTCRLCMLEFEDDLENVLKLDLCYSCIRIVDGMKVKSQTLLPIAYL